MEVMPFPRLKHKQDRYTNTWGTRLHPPFLFTSTCRPFFPHVPGLRYEGTGTISWKAPSRHWTHLLVGNNPPWIRVLARRRWSPGHFRPMGGIRRTSNLSAVVVALSPEQPKDDKKNYTIIMVLLMMTIRITAVWIFKNDGNINKNNNKTETCLYIFICSHYTKQKYTNFSYTFGSTSAHPHGKLLCLPIRNPQLWRLRTHPKRYSKGRGLDGWCLGCESPLKHSVFVNLIFSSSQSLMAGRYLLHPRALTRTAQAIYTSSCP